MVVDEKGAPMPNAFVAIMVRPTTAHPSTYTDANGNYHLDDVTTGMQTVEARQWRYETLDRRWTSTASRQSIS